MLTDIKLLLELIAHLAESAVHMQRCGYNVSPQMQNIDEIVNRCISSIDAELLKAAESEGVSEGIREQVRVIG